MSPPAPLRIRSSRYAQPSPPAAIPSGIAGGAAAIAAAARCPCPASCHMAANARYGAAATRNQARTRARPRRVTPPAPATGRRTAGSRVAAARTGQAATAISQAATMGRHHSGGHVPTRRGGTPRHQPYQNAPAATTVTGASSTATATHDGRPHQPQQPAPRRPPHRMRTDTCEARWRLTAATRSR